MPVIPTQSSGAVEKASSIHPGNAGTLKGFFGPKWPAYKLS